MVFFISCYLGLRKPDPRIYRVPVGLCQNQAEECAFVDHRPRNVEAVGQLGMRAIRFQNGAQLRRELAPGY